MKKDNNIIMACLLALCLASGTGCSDDMPAVDASGPQVLDFFPVQFSASGSASAVESAIERIDAFRFEDGVLSEIRPDVHPDEMGRYVIGGTGKTGTIYFIANPGDMMDYEGLVPGETGESDFLGMYTLPLDTLPGHIFMTGKLELPVSGNKVQVPMERGVARLDINVATDDVEVAGIRLKSAAASSKVFNDDVTDALVSHYDAEMSFASPIVSSCKGVAYILEQYDGLLSAEVHARIGGNNIVIPVAFPGKIRRNTVYTLQVEGKGAELEVSICEENDWETGDTADSDEQLVPAVKMDMIMSRLPEGAVVSEGKDTLFVPYTASEVLLVLDVAPDASVSLRGNPQGVAFSEFSGNSVSFTTLLRKPGDPREFAYLDVAGNSGESGRFVISFEPNACKFTGFGDWDDNYVCDYDTYVEGTLGTITIPEGKELQIVFPEGEKHWIMVDRNDADRVYRLVAGWKPNDPEADGRKQTAYVVISSSGRSTEQYTLVRRNWGLPVEEINGVWWCKYNLRGNSRSFADQILPKDDPSAEGGFFEYLRDCSDIQFLAAAGDQYQGGYPDGLSLSVTDDGLFFYEGMLGSAKAWNSFARDYMTPPGYQIPDYGQFRFFSANDNFNLGYKQDAFNNGLGQRLNIRTAERSLSVDGHDYGTVTIHEFTYDGASMLLYGLGHQWNTSAGNVSKMAAIYATYAGASWMTEGFPQSSGQGNWIKYVNQNSTKTRNIRCTKIPVEYIYE